MIRASRRTWTARLFVAAFLVVVFCVPEANRKLVALAAFLLQ